MSTSDFQNESIETRIFEKDFKKYQLKTILENSSRALIITDNQSEDMENSKIFEDYLKSFCDEVKVETVALSGEMEFEKKDAIFCCFFDVSKYLVFLNSALKSGVSPFQVISPELFFFPCLAAKRGFILKPNLQDFQLPVLATIDTVNMCNLDCATCTKPEWQENNERMDFDLFVKILDKLQVMNIRAVELYNYTEPFLNPNLYQFMAEVKRRGLTLGISTNLSRPRIPNLKKCVDLLQPHDWFVITISGIKQEVYEINHRRGKIANVIENIQEIAKSQNKEQVRLRLLKFDYNIGEYEAAKALAKKYGIGFEHYPAIGNPFEPFKDRKTRKDILDKKINFQDYSDSFSAERPYCFFIHSRNMIINHRGNVELCCQNVQRPYDLGSFLEQDISVIQLKRDLHPLCRSCRYHETEEAKGITKACPVYPVKANRVLQHGMKTMSLLREFSQEANFSSYRYINTSKNFLVNAVKYFVASE